jgi:hypothetical protein
MRNELSPAQLRKALCSTMSLTADQLSVFEKMLTTLQPWEASFLTTLLDERARDKKDLEMMRLMRSFDWKLGEKAGTLQTPFQLPGGYQVATHPEFLDQFYVFRMLNGVEQIYLDDVADEADAIEAAYALDRKDDPYRWRPVTETCPSQSMLQFACANWAHSVSRGKPVPVKTGYRDGDTYTIFGASWLPTHWCYSPEPPAAVAEQPALATV